MKYSRTDNNFGEKYAKIKRAFMTDPMLRQKHLDPIKEWQTWIDLNNEDLQKLTNYLLHELVFNEPLTSITKIIPLVENNDLKVGVTLYMDKDCIYATNSIKNSFSPLFISANDLVNILEELIGEDEHNFAMREAYYKIAWKLQIVDDLKDKMRR